jgi:glycosyl transferase, family 25
VNIAALILHLERASERRANVDELRRRLPVESEVVPACDGATLRAQDVRRAYVRRRFAPRYPFALAGAEIGAFLSHRAAWDRILAAGLDYGLVFEDDAEIDAQVFARLTAFLEKQKGPLDYALLPAGRAPTGRLVHVSDGFTVTEPFSPPLRAIAQVVSRAAAERLLACTEPFDRPVDTFLQMIWVTGTPVTVISPSGVVDVSQRSGGTTVGRKNMSIAQKLHHEIARPLYRSRVLAHYRRALTALSDASSRT